MRLLFAGTPQIAAPALIYLSQRFTIVGVLCSPDASQGRSKTLLPPPVKTAALQASLNILQPETLDAAFEQQTAALNAHLLVCFAYGKIFKPSFLSLFPSGGINLHPSLLPRWRGPSPIQAAILAGDSQTGISVQRLANKMDAGDILTQKPISLTGEETAESLSLLIEQQAGPELEKAIKLLQSDSKAGIRQDESQAVYCKLLKKSDGKLDFNLEAETLSRRVRAMRPWPGAYAYAAGEKIAILEAKSWPDIQLVGETGSLCADPKRGLLIKTAKGALGALTLQAPGKKALNFKDFINGRPGLAGSRME